MAGRFLFVVTQNLRLAHKQFLLSRNTAVWNRQCNARILCFFPGSMRHLHEKRYDSEAKSKTFLAHDNTRNDQNFQLEEKTQNELHAHRSSETVLDDADNFGNTKTPDDAKENQDRIEEEYQNRPTRRMRKMSTREYANQIKEYLKAHRLKEAIAVLELRMLKEDRAKPENYIYNLLISGCAKEGSMRKAFSLFTRMRQRGLKVTGGTYTSLLNACANAPSAGEGLDRANRVREIMIEKGYEPNEKNYNAMIKAYGRCGDVQTAFQLADEMIERRLPMNTDTYNFLLQACASDKQHGFRHCLLTWHKMLRRGIRPDYYTFHTVLRCVRDCGFGDLESMQQVLEQILTQPAKLKSNQTLHITSGDKENQRSLVNSGIDQPNQLVLTVTEVESEFETVEGDLVLPNLLAKKANLGSMISLSEVHQPHERFLLLGGLSGFLALMKEHNVTPNIQVFTTMLEVVPPTNAMEKEVLAYIRRIGLKADIDFFNILIKKRAMRFDYDGAKEVLSMVRTAGLHPDIVTFGVLALGCQTEQSARELLQTMRDSNIRMNIQILGAMLRQGCAQKSFAYVSAIMQISLDEHIKPNEMFLRHLYNFYNQCARAIDARHPYTKKKGFKFGHANFCEKLRLYYEEQGVGGLKLEDAIKKIQERPYDQYKEADVEGFEPLKNERDSRKNKLRKYIKKIKIENLQSDVRNQKSIDC